MGGARLGNYAVGVCAGMLLWGATSASLCAQEPLFSAPFNQTYGAGTPALPEYGYHADREPSLSLAAGQVLAPTPHFAPASHIDAAPSIAPAPRYEPIPPYPQIEPTSPLDVAPPATAPQPPVYMQPAPPCNPDDEWRSRWMPVGLIYRSYLAGAREPRFASVWTSEKDYGSLWEVSLGGRAAIWRYGTADGIRPQGWEIDLEGACFPRLDPLEYSTPLLACDFRFGLPITYGVGPWAFKTGYYHISSHLGDELLIAQPWIQRSNYSRDAIMLGASYYWGPNIRLYGETAWSGWADSSGGVAAPWEFQFGAEYSPITFDRGAPFAAINGRLLEESDFGGIVVVQTGWQAPQGPSGHRFRIGVEYSNGHSRQDSFFRQSEQQIGFGLWYDM